MPMARHAAYPLALAVRALSHPASDRRLHDARKALKKARAALRLLRDDLGERRFRAENRALRDVGRALSPLRDARVMLETLRLLDPGGLEALSARLQRELQAQRRQFTAAARRRIGAAIQQSRERLDGRAPTPAALRHGLKRIYRSGRRAQPRGPGPQTAALHEWRKQAKYLRNALSWVPGEAAKKAANLARRLGDALGSDHDAAVLWMKTLREPGPAGEAPARQELRRRLSLRRSQLQAEALKLGAALYAPAPEAFVRRVLDQRG